MMLLSGKAQAQANTHTSMTITGCQLPVFDFCRINKTLERYQGCRFDPHDNSTERETSQVCVCRNSLLNLYFISSSICYMINRFQTLIIIFSATELNLHRLRSLSCLFINFWVFNFFYSLLVV